MLLAQSLNSELTPLLAAFRAKFFGLITDPIRVDSGELGEGRLSRMQLIHNVQSSRFVDAETLSIEIDSTQAVSVL